MSQPLVVTNTITIHAPATKVWDALTNPEQTKKYMFGCEAQSDWKPGSPLIWKGSFNGVEMIAVKGKVVSIDAPRLLVYTVIDPNNPKIPDLPENYLTVTCKLTERDGQTTLVVSQGDYSTVAEGPDRYKHTVEGGGWDPVLVQIKALCEG
ncbi:MAG TPA: SRPBCC domain-containing protein [Puia sp.]|nr:SRPBCC domain-containing protein [Puia sp.]